ncbi:MAG: PsiF family protein [Steroidobacteraceae bacterium]|jgi:hypothetical protein
MRASSARGQSNAILERGLHGDHALGYIMRTFLPAVLACLALASVASGWLIAAAAAAGASPTKTPAPASAPSTAAPKPAAAGSSIDNDAPARHARRTACLKDAKTKKLVGAQRTAYVKDCMAAP